MIPERQVHFYNLGLKRDLCFARFGISLFVRVFVIGQYKISGH